ncbi:hypothetical protein C8T65DRAFT_741036 [Cerioporus squamosus]|nr:hypothetical protein C8T65DRAFT_741036 [Cerioporus squamosus]
MSNDMYAAIVSLYVGARYNYSSSIAAAVLLIYDYLITFNREVELFWTSPNITAAPLLFYTTRYLGLLSVILTRVKGSPAVSLETNFFCRVLVKIGSIVDYFQVLPVGIFSALRVFALSKGNWWISLLVFMLSVVSLGTNLSLFNMGLTGTIDTINGCAATAHITLKTAITEVLLWMTLIDSQCCAVTIVTNATFLLANAIIIAVTWSTLGVKSLRSLLARDMQRGFATILLWNGTIYFIALSFLSVIHVIFTVTSIFYGGVGSALSLLGPPLTNILVWRFMIDLQDANQSQLKIGSDDPLYLATDGGGSLSFARAIGSIGSIVTSDALEFEDENQLAFAEPETVVDIHAASEGTLSRTG